jgi:hypothetical protein
MSDAMIKDDARNEVLRLWRALPVAERRSFAQAQAFAVKIDPTIDFRTMGDKLKVITAWLHRDLLDLAEVQNTVRRRVREKQHQIKAAG